MAEAVTLVNLRQTKKLEDFKKPQVIVCKKCKEMKDRKEFVQGASYKLGCREICKVCESKAVKEREEAKKIDTSIYFDF